MQKINVYDWANKEIELLNKDNKGLIYEDEYNSRNNKVLELYNNIINTLTDTNQLECLMKLLLNKPITPINKDDEFFHSCNNPANYYNCMRDYRLTKVIDNNTNVEYKYNYKIKYYINGYPNPYIDSKVNKLILYNFPIEFPFVPDTIHVYIDGRLLINGNRYIWKILLLSKENDINDFIDVNKCYCNEVEISEDEYNKYIETWK